MTHNGLDVKEDLVDNTMIGLVKCEEIGQVVLYMGEYVLR